MAESIRATDATIAVGPRSGWAPSDAAWRYSVFPHGETWLQSLYVLSDEPRLGVEISPNGSSPRDNTLPIEPVRVDDLDGVFVPAANHVYVTRPDGVNASFFYEGSRTDALARDRLLRAVRDFEFGPSPDMSWVGQR